MNKLLVALCLSLAYPVEAGECHSLELVEWILGEWATSAGNVVVHESWRRVSDLTFEGESISTTLADDEVVNDETLRLVAMSDGVFYIAKVAHNDLPVAFRLTECTEGFAKFENPDHDAPQRLVYRLLGDSDTGTPTPALEVRVEGDRMDDFSLLFRRP